jgi:O-antigen ligase
LGKAYNIWLSSGALALLQVFFRAFSRAFSASAIVRRLTSDSRIEPVFSRAAFARVFKWLFDCFYALLRRICDWTRRAAQGSLTESFVRRYVRGSFFLSFETILGGFLCLMYIIPHAYWSNTYALLGVFALCALYFLAVGARARKPFYIHELGLSLFLFAIACCLGVVASFDRSDSLRVFLFFLTSLMLLYVITADITTKQRLMKLLGFIYTAVIFTAIYAIYQRFVGVDVSASFTDLAVNEGVPGRVYSTLDNPNNYAEFLVMLTPLAAVFAANIKRTLLRVSLCAGIAFPFLALLMTYSRSGWISILIACIVFIYYVNKKLIPIFFLFCFAALPLLPDSVMIRIASLFRQDSSNMFRIYIWGGTVNIARDYLATGIGLGPATFAEIYPEYANPMAQLGVMHSHMVYLELIIEMGILGFVSFMWYMLRLFKDSACAACRARNPFLRLVCIACLASLVGIALTFAVEYVWFYPRTMFTWFILAGIATAAIRIQKNGDSADLP